MSTVNTAKGLLRVVFFIFTYILNTFTHKTTFHFGLATCTEGEHLNQSL